MTRLHSEDATKYRFSTGYPEDAALGKIVLNPAKRVFCGVRAA